MVQAVMTLDAWAYSPGERGGDPLRNLAPRIGNDQIAVRRRKLAAERVGEDRRGRETRLDREEQRSEAEHHDEDDDPQDRRDPIRGRFVACDEP
ncbi:MAG: hypothetical protein NVSMB21_19170 [Vulcanimicrobiaceae bacterium]